MKAPSTGVADITMAAAVQQGADGLVFLLGLKATVQEYRACGERIANTDAPGIPQRESIFHMPVGELQSLLAGAARKFAGGEAFLVLPSPAQRLILASNTGNASHIMIVVAALESGTLAGLGHAVG